MPQDKEWKLILAFSLIDVKQEAQWNLACMYADWKYM